MAEEPAQFLIGEVGRKYVCESLSSRDPKAVIDEMHANLGIPAFVPTAAPLLPLLDLLGHTRADVHASVMDVLRVRLLEEVERLPQERVLVLLQRVIPYMGVAEVTPVCSALLARCGSIPLDVLEVLAEPDNYVHAPLGARQQIWHVREDLFREAIFPLLSTYIADARNVAAAHDALRLTPSGRMAPRQRRETDAALREICHLVGEDRALYLTVCSFLRTLYVNTGHSLFCTLRTTVLMAAHDREPSTSAVHVSQWDPCHRCAWALDAAIRDGIASTRGVRELAAYLPPHGPHAPRSAQELGDLAMVFRDPHAVHVLCGTAIARVCALVDAAAREGGGEQQAGREGREASKGTVIHLSLARAGARGAAGRGARGRGVALLQPRGEGSEGAGALASADGPGGSDGGGPVSAEQLSLLLRAGGAAPGSALAAGAADDEVLRFVARALTVAHAASPLLKGEASVPTDDRSLSALLGVCVAWLCEMRAEDAERHARAVQADGWLDELRAGPGGPDGPAAGGGGRAAEDDASAGGGGDGGDAAGASGREGGRGGMDAVARRSTAEPAPKRPRREGAGARGRELAAQAAQAAQAAGSDAEEAGEREAAADGGDGSSWEGADDENDDDDDEHRADAADAEELQNARAALFSRSGAARRLVLHYALLRARALDVPRCTALFRLAGPALAECVAGGLPLVGEHMDFVYSLVELLSVASAASESAAEAAAAAALEQQQQQQQHGEGGGGGGSAAAAAAAAALQGSAPPDVPAFARAGSTGDADLAAAGAAAAGGQLFEAALHTLFLPLAVSSAPCHEQLVRLLCIYAVRCGEERAAELTRWASSNGQFDDSGLVDCAYRELLRIVPSLQPHMQLPSARAVALKKAPSSAASDVVSDGTHMEAAGLHSWQGDDESGSGGLDADGGAEPAQLGGESGDGGWAGQDDQAEQQGEGYEADDATGECGA